MLASYGHVRDLVPKEGAVNPENDFEMKYEIIEKNEKHVNAITKALKKSEALYLATDPDREGEAISWHLHELLKDRGLLEGKEVYRVVFHEITKSAVKNAVANPRKLSDDLINAQLARRALDYLVGFNLSPLLWKKLNVVYLQVAYKVQHCDYYVNVKQKLKNLIRKNTGPLRVIAKRKTGILI